MDIDKLNKEIISTLDTDGLAQSYLVDTTSTKYARWSKDTLGFIWIDQRIYVPPSGDLRLHVLCTYHDHPVRGHLRSPIPLTEYVYLDIPDTLCLSNSPYIPPHQRQIPFPSDSFVCASVCPNSET